MGRNRKQGSEVSRGEEKEKEWVPGGEDYPCLWISGPNLWKKGGEKKKKRRKLRGGNERVPRDQDEAEREIPENPVKGRGEDKPVIGVPA